MKILYFSRYFDRDGEPTSPVGHAVLVDHDARTIESWFNVEDPESSVEADFGIMVRSNRHLGELLRFLKDNGYSETRVYEGPHP